MRRWDARRLVFIDESGVNLSLTRSQGWSKRGERIIDFVPGDRWQNCTVIAALRSGGIVAPMVLPGALDTAALRVWVAEQLAPELNRGDIVIWDNLSVHGDAEVASSLRSHGVALEFLPAYSPDLNPIELAWSKTKDIPRTIGARTAHALVDGLADALSAVTKADCAGWFHHAGYAAT